MKKLFVIALAAMGMVACVQNEVVDVVKSDAIAFDGTFVENSTRAEVGEATDPSFGVDNELTAFNVWGFMNVNDGTVFSGNEVTKNGEVWGYDDIQYWMPGNTYYFAGVAPVENNHWTATNGDTQNLYPVDVIDFENVDGTEDLLYAYATVTTLNPVQTMDAVDMQFKHLLSKVKFTFQNTFATSNVKVEVRDVKMVAPATASINIVSNEWANHAGELTLAFGATEKIDALGDKHEATTELMTIPTADYDYVVTFTVDVYQGEQLAYTVEKTSTISGLAFEQGKAYNLTATINQDVLDLKPIEFTATVVDWVEAGDFVFPAYRVSTADELAAALKSTENVIDVVLLNDIDLPITSLGTITPGSGEYKLGGENTKELTIDLNGKKLNITTTYWSALGANNADALITIKNGSMTSTGNSAGTWNAWDLRFSNCNYVFENVTFEKAVALDNVAKTVSMKNVTITDTHNTDTYGLWITAEGQTVTLEDCVIDMTPATDGRAIKIDEQYVEDTKAKVTLNVKNLKVASDEKAAILVKSAKGAEINVDGIDITGVAEDTVFAVWVDKDAAKYADLVVVNGARCKVEGTTVADDATQLEAALAAGTGTIVLAENVDYGTIVAAELKNATIVGAEGAVMIFKTTDSSKIENVTLQNVNFEYTGATADCGVVIAANAQIDNLVIENCTVVGTGAKAGRGLSGPNNNATIVIKNTTFKDLGYPIYAWGGYEALTIEGCTFEGIVSWCVMPQSGFDGDLTVTGCNFVDCKGGIVKGGTLTAGHTFTFTNNTITNSTEHPNRNWFEFNVAAGTVVLENNIMDGAAWTPTAAEGLKGI